jgi:hypothetical protein
MKVTNNPRRPDEGPELEGDRLAIRDAVGNLWRISEPEPGVLTVMLADTPTGDTGMLVEPQVSNLIRVRNRPLEWTVKL